MKGGDQPTLTDAHVVTGRLNRERLLGGHMIIDASLAEAAIARLGKRIGLSTEAMAAGIITLTVSNISAAIREMTVERGVNPRDLTLVAYGGGGPTLACDVANDLEIPAILVPRNPGLTSASGLLLTDIRHDYVRTFLRRNDNVTAGDVQRIFGELIALGDAKLQHENIRPDDRLFELAVDLRYVGQTHELKVAVGDRYDEARHAGLSEALRIDHLKQFGHAPDGIQPVEIVSLRVAAIGRVPRAEFGKVEAKPVPLPIATRSIHVGGSRFDTPVYSRETLGDGNRLTGPSIIEQLDTTTVVTPGWSGAVLPSGSILFKKEPT
jgi:N-methylhydantoinase A